MLIPSLAAPADAGTPVSATIGRAWQVTGAGVRRVIIRRPLGPTSYAVSRLVYYDATRTTGGFCPRSKPANAADLFLDQTDARTEFLRRQRLTRCANDRRVGRQPAELNVAGGVAFAAALGVWLLGLFI